MATSRKAQTIVRTEWRAGAWVLISLLSLMIGHFGGESIGPRLAGPLSQVPALAPYAGRIGFIIGFLVMLFVFGLIGELVPKRIGTMQPSLHHLARIEEEILRQDRAGESGPRRCQIGQRASETRRVDEHAERIGNAIVTACDRSDIGAAANHSNGRRGFLDFEDEPRAGPGERILETERGSRRI